MKILGIIAEYNPFHSGHKYHIEKAKKITSADYVICIMSGNFTQQGNVAVLDKFTRAKIACSYGVDLVLELPTVFATSSSEYFAKSAISILHSLGCIDYICFGSEAKNIEEFNEVYTHITQNKAKIDIAIKTKLDTGMAFQNAKIKSICEEYNGKLDIDSFFKSNNILGLEYVMALKSLNSTIQPLCIHRSKSTYNSKVVALNGLSSATSIREYLYANNDLTKLTCTIPEISLKSLQNSYLPKNEDFYSVFRYIVLGNKNIIKDIDDISEGLENRIYANAVKCTSYGDFLNATITKRYTLSKIKRIYCKILLNITKEKSQLLYEKNALYARILALNTNSKCLLGHIAKSANLPILSMLNQASYKELNENQKCLLDVDILATNLFDIIQKKTLNNDYFNRL
ncbi:MAG: nucleotidyltransferase [Clostridia bacterium]